MNRAFNPSSTENPTEQVLSSITWFATVDPALQTNRPAGTQETGNQQHPKSDMEAVFPWPQREKAQPHRQVPAVHEFFLSIFPTQFLHLKFHLVELFFLLGPYLNSQFKKSRCYFSEGV